MSVTMKIKLSPTKAGELYTKWSNLVEDTKKIHPTQDPKYGIKNNQIVNMATGKPIPDDEPIMLFRAKDKNAEEAVGYYSGLCKNKDHQQAVSLRHYQFINFKDSHPEKMGEPDTQIS